MRMKQCCRNESELLLSTLCLSILEILPFLSEMWSVCPTREDSVCAECWYVMSASESPPGHLGFTLLELPCQHLQNGFNAFSMCSYLFHFNNFSPKY